MQGSYQQEYERSLGVSNNCSDYANYNPKVEGTLNYLQRDGSLARSQQRGLYRNGNNLLINKKSQDIAKNYVSPYSQRLDINHSVKQDGSPQRVITEIQEHSKDRKLYTYDELYQHRPQYTMSSQTVIQRPGHQHTHQHVSRSPEGHAQITTTTSYVRPVIEETVHIHNQYPETKYYQRSTSRMSGYVDDVPGRRMYEKLPVDVRERNQTRIPSPGHKVTYHEHFGLLGETIQRPPENMKEWLTRNYGKNSTFIDTLQKTPEKIAEQVTYEVQPVEFHLIPEPVVHHEIVFHQPI